MWHPHARDCPPHFGEQILALGEDPTLLSVANEPGDGKYIMSAKAWRELWTVVTTTIIKDKHHHEDGGDNTITKADPSPSSCLTCVDTKRNIGKRYKKVSFTAHCIGNFECSVQHMYNLTMHCLVKTPHTQP